MGIEKIVNIAQRNPKLKKFTNSPNPKNNPRKPQTKPYKYLQNPPNPKNSPRKPQTLEIFLNSPKLQK
jgi:hypothetical protein